MKEPPSSCPTDARVPSSSGVSIVVPTYREAANLRAIARRVASVMSATGVAWELGLGVHVGGYALPTTFVEPFAQHRLPALIVGVPLGSIVNHVLANGYVYRRAARTQADQRRRRR